MVIIVVNVEKLSALWRVMTKYKFAVFCDHGGKCDMEFVYVLVLNLCWTFRFIEMCTLLILICIHRKTL